MVLAIVLIVLAVLLGLGGLVFTALKWLLIVAVVLLPSPASWPGESRLMDTVPDGHRATDTTTPNRPANGLRRPIAQCREIPGGSTCLAL